MFVYLLNFIDMEKVHVTEKAKEKVKMAHGLMKEFKEFLYEYKILGIAAGLVIGSAVTTVTQSLVVGLISPLIQLLIPSESFKTVTLNSALKILPSRRSTSASILSINPCCKSSGIWVSTNMRLLSVNSLNALVPSSCSLLFAPTISTFL